MRKSLIALLVAGLGVAQERATVEPQIEALIKGTKLSQMTAAQPVWSELGPPIWTIGKVTKVSADVVVVEADCARTSSSGLTVSIPMLFVLEKNAQGWRIAMQRELAPGLGREH